MPKRDVDTGRFPEDTQAVRAVHRAKRELEQMIDLTPQIMLLLNKDGTVGRANLAFLRFLGLTDFRQVLGQRLDAFVRVGEEAFLATLLAMEGHYARREAGAVLKGGRTGVFRFTMVGIGEVSDARVLIIEDITEEKAQAARDEKEHKKDAVKALAGALMHNINQRLTVITVRAKLMLMALEKDTIPTAELARSLNDIMSLTMEVAGILDRVDHQKDFVTERYLDGLDILDLERSSDTGEND